MDTIRDIAEEIARLVIDAETHAILGERMAALSMILKASGLYNEFAPYIKTFADVDLLTARIETIARNLCLEANVNDA